jgi:hypothetical protein
LDRTNGNGLRYSIIKPEEWHRLEPLFRKLNFFLPPQILANCAIAENDCRDIVAFQVLQMVLHAEPSYIQPEYRGMVNLLRMWRLLEDLPKDKNNPMIVPGYLLIAPNENIARLAELGGFEAIKGTIYKKEW